MNLKSSAIQFLLVVIFCNINLCFSNFVLRKCCPIGYTLNNTLNGCTETNNGEKEWKLEKSLTDILPKNFKPSIPKIFNENSTFNIPCQYPKIETLMWFDEDSQFNISNKGILTPSVITSPKDFNSTEFCLDIIKNDYGLEATVAITCPCLRGVCVHMCCEEGRILDINNETQKAECIPVFDKWQNWKISNNSVPPENQKFYAVYGAQPQCSDNESPSVLKDGFVEAAKISFSVLANGTLKHTTDVEDTAYLNASKYCVGVMNYGHEIDINVILCSEMHDTSKELLHAKIYSTLFIIGSLFLLATLIVHIMLPELRRAVQGLSLMAHCTCMLVAHIALTIVQLEGSVIADGPCYFLAYLIQFSLLAGFFWMNVMCIDISSTFRSLRSMVPGRSGEMKKFLFYTIYAMGIPFIIFVITIAVDSSPGISSKIKPDIGKNFCWFNKETLAILAFFYGPMGLLLLLNFSLFVFTASKIISFEKANSILKRNTDSQRHDPNSDRKSFVLFVKLFGLMGIPWIMEIISWAVGGEEYYWYLPDAINLLRSVFIFIMFCCKEKVWELLQTRYPCIFSHFLKSKKAPKSETSSQTMHSNLDVPTTTQDVRLSPIKNGRKKSETNEAFAKDEQNL